MATTEEAAVTAEMGFDELRGHFRGALGPIARRAGADDVVAAVRSPASTTCSRRCAEAGTRSPAVSVCEGGRAVGGSVRRPPGPADRIEDEHDPTNFFRLNASLTPNSRGGNEDV